MDRESWVHAITQGSDWLKSQLEDLKARVEQDQDRLTAFQTSHRLLSTPEVAADGQPGESQHNSTLLEIDELGHQFVVATTDRILREAELRAASQGDPELVIASDPQLQVENGNLWRFTANLMIWIGKSEPKTPSCWTVSAARGRRHRTVSNW